MFQGFCICKQPLSSMCPQGKAHLSLSGLLVTLANMSQPKSFPKKVTWGWLPSLINHTATESRWPEEQHFSQLQHQGRHLEHCTTIPETNQFLSFLPPLIIWLWNLLKAEPASLPTFHRPEEKMQQWEKINYNVALDKQLRQDVSFFDN